MEDAASFARLVDAIRPWLGHLVIVGGWAHRLHRFHRLANSLEYQPLRTRDVDIAFRVDAPLSGDLRTALAVANFTEAFSGDHTPPLTEYRLSNEDDGFYVEFLTPLQGDGLKRTGKPDITLDKAGISAQKLRYVELLLLEPWIVKIGPSIGVPVAGNVDLQIPNPVSFIIQKLLVHNQRKPEKKQQDVLYIHDTLELFGTSLNELRRLWTNEVRPSMRPKTAMKAMAIAVKLFENVTETIRGAAQIPHDRDLQAENVRALCNYGLDELFRRS